MDFLFAPQNLPFAVAIGVMLGIAVLEGVLTVIGLGFSSLLDNLLPDGLADLDLDADVDADLDLDLDADAELPTGSGIDPGASLDPAATDVGSTWALSRLLGWLAIGRVPVLVSLVVFLTAFGLAGYLLQGLLRGVTSIMLPGWIAWVPALAAALPLTSSANRGIARLIPKDETSAVSREGFVGRIAVITLGEARPGRPAQARLRDEHGKRHYVMVQPDRAEETFESGTEVLLVARKGATFDAIRNPSAALVDR